MTDSPIRVSGHLQLKGPRGSRRWHACWRVGDSRHHKILGLAHAKDSGRRTSRGAIVWRAGDGRKPTPEHLTPDEAHDQLASLLARERAKQPTHPVRRRASSPPPPPKTLGEARDEWLHHITIDRNRRPSTVRDYRGRSGALPSLVVDHDDGSGWRVVSVEQWAELRREHFVAGKSIKELVRSTGLSRNTIRRALRSGRPPSYQRPLRASVWEPF
jgi:hypothetical protein